MAHFNRIEGAFINIGTTFLGFFYIVIPLSLIVNIVYFLPDSRFEGEGIKWLVYLLIDYTIIVEL